MPRHIRDKNTGKMIRVWDKEEWEARYRQGRHDAGERSCPDKSYTEEALRKRYEYGVSIAQQLFPVAIRGAFEHGWKEGEKIGKAVEKEAFTPALNEELKRAQTRGFTEAQQNFQYKLQNRRTELQDAYLQDEADMNAWFKSDFGRMFKQDAIKTYQFENSWHMRAGSAYDQFMATRKNSFLHTAFTSLGSLPLGTGRLPYKGYQDHYFSGESKLKLADIRKIPWSILTRFSSMYILAPYMLYKFFDADLLKPGETDIQYQTRKAGEKDCKALTSLQPELFGLSNFTPEQTDQIAYCAFQCNEKQKDWRKVSADISNLVVKLTRHGIYRQKNIQPETNDFHDNSYSTEI